MIYDRLLKPVSIMYQDLNAMTPPPATVSGNLSGNLGSALPDPLSTGDAMEKYEQVSQKVMTFGEIFVH